MTVTHPLALAWLERVERLAADLPPGDRTELLDDLREHIATALVATTGDDGDVALVLERLGDPAEVVAAARQDVPVGPVPAVVDTSATPPEGLLTPEVIALAALVLAGLGGFLVWPVTIVLWVTGIVLVAVAGRWRGGEVPAMVLLPIAWAFPVVAMLVPVGSTSTSCTSTSDGVEQCEVIEQGIGGPWALVVALLVLVLIVLGTRWLARAPQGRPRR